MPLMRKINYVLNLRWNSETFPVPGLVDSEMELASHPKFAPCPARPLDWLELYARAPAAARVETSNRSRRLIVQDSESTGLAVILVRSIGTRTSGVQSFRVQLIDP